MGSMRRILVTAMALVAAVPTTAGATARYASPSGGGDTCTQAQPCDIVEAVNNASAGDDITILPGGYAPSVTLDDQGRALSIHGRAGQPRPDGSSWQRSA